MADWTKGFPAWTAPVIGVMKRLDASDAPKKGSKLDGRYMGLDLVNLAKLYAQKYKTHQASFLRVFDATDGLRNYVQQFKNDDGKAIKRSDLHAMVANAMF